MGCENRKTNTGYSEPTSIDMKDLVRQGNASISGMLGKCPAVRRKGCR